MNYTVIGDPVNLAARLESMNKQFDTRVMVSEMTAERLIGVFVLRLLMPIAVVGKEQPVKVFEVMGLLREFDATRIAALQESDRTIGLEDQSHSDRGSSASGSVSVSAAPAQAAGPRARRGKSATVAALRESAMRTASEASLTCTPEEVAFCAEHCAAVAMYIGGQFGRAIEAFNRLEAAHPAMFVDGSCRVAACSRRSVELVRGLCEKYLQEGAPENFDGVYRALEK
mmetsp:Transcript_22207/g.68924  ORF Transcript_22207/g.68924 Transcript_22207/m.68924 type:complete len:228 (-) Transcript_22207:43-726(-)